MPNEFAKHPTSKKAPPAIVTWNGIRADIGVQPCEVPRFVPPASKVFHRLPDIDVAVIQVSVVNRLLIIVAGDSQRIDRAIGKNGTGATPGFAIKPLSTEN